MSRILRILSLLTLFLASSCFAQTNVAPPPNFTFVSGGSAVGFSGAGTQGSQVGSMAFLGVQLTKDTSSVVYEHITVPSISARYELGVATYTKPASSLLGSLASKLSINTTNINVTFSAGAGKALFPTGNHIAETVGASLSYPIPGTSAAFQILGYQLVHSPGKFGAVTRDYQQQVQSGLIVYF